MKTGIVFTVLPQSVWEARPRFSIYTTLRPEADKQGRTLADFPTTANWPTVVRSATFDLYVLASPKPQKVGTCHIQPYGDASKAQRLYSQMLPLSTVVLPPAAEALTDRPIVSYDFERMTDVMTHVYAPLTKGGTNSDLKTIPGLDWWGSQEVMQSLQGLQVDTAPRSAFWDFARYHLPDPAASRSKRIAEADIDDFDRRISDVGNYPALYRMLGLILDVEVELLPNISMPSHGAVGVLPVIRSEHKDAIEFVLPWSLYERFEHNGQTYAHMQGDEPRRRGFYSMDRNNVRLIQYDLDTGVDGLMRAARAEKDVAAGLLSRADVPSTPPALSSPGFSFYDTAVLEELKGSKSREQSLRTMALKMRSAKSDPPTMVVTAADVESGCRVDVFWSRTGQWYSLSEQVLTLTDASGEDHPLAAFGPQEGFVSIATGSTIDPNSATSSLAKSSQRLFFWYGWSHATPWVGNPVGDGGKPMPVAPLVLGARWQVRSRVKSKSIARLRFGDWYKFRSRTADLAGNGWTLEMANALHETVSGLETALTQFLRNDPVPAPVVLAPDPLTLGEKISVVAVGEGRHRTRRMFHPPKTSFDLLVKHGVFDPLSEDESYALVQLAERTEDSKTISFPYTADAIAAGAMATIEGSRSEMSLGSLPFSPGVVREEGDGIELLVSTGAFAAWQRGQRFFVSLPKGESRRFRLRSTIAEADRKLLAFDGGADEPSPLSAPWTEILLVHPSEVPLGKPAHGDHRILDRKRGQTEIAFFDPLLTTHAETTSRVTFEAKWTDAVDDPAEPDWSYRQGSGQIAAQDIDLPASDPMAFSVARSSRRQARLSERRLSAAGAVRVGLFNDHPDSSNSFDFQDTHSHRLIVTPLAHPRHAEFFDAKKVKTLAGNPVEVIVKSTANPPVPKVDYILPTSVRTRTRLKRGQALHRTEGWALRVFLTRDWRADQRLAVIFGSDAAPYSQSAIGLDPLVAAAHDLPPLTPEDLGGDVREHLLPLSDEYEGEAGPHAVSVRFVTFAPLYDPETNLRYVDLVFRPRPFAYLPFVRLVFARYVEHSIKGAELSRAALSHWAQIGGNRSVTTVRLSERETLVRIVADAADDSRPGSRTRYVAHAEFSDYNRGSEYGWMHLDGSEVELQPIRQSGPYVWEGRVRTSAWRLFGRRRIVIRELLDMSAPQCPGEVSSRLIEFEIADL